MHTMVRGRTENLTAGFSPEQAKLLPLGWIGPVVVDPQEQFILPAQALGPVPIQVGECCLVKYMGADGVERQGQLPLGRNPEAPQSLFWLPALMFDPPATIPGSAGQLENRASHPAETDQAETPPPTPPTPQTPAETPDPAPASSAPSSETPATEDQPQARATPSGDVAATGHPAR